MLKAPEKPGQPSSSKAAASAATNVPAARIKTRILIIADTFGTTLPSAEHLPAADVVIHCGNLAGSWRSNIPPDQQYQRIFQMLRQIPAPVKIAIPGRSDICLEPEFEELVSEDPQATIWRSHVHLSNEIRTSEATGQDGIQLLITEDTRDVVLKNGAKMRIFHSPYTPNVQDLEPEAFMYMRGTHEFNIPLGVDVAITNGPPGMILDYTPLSSQRRIGCRRLLCAVAKARPRIHCFSQRGYSNGIIIGSFSHSKPIPPVTYMRNFYPPGWTSAGGPYFHTLKVKETDLTDMGNPFAIKGMVLDLKEGEHILFVNATRDDRPVGPFGEYWSAKQYWYCVELELPEATPEEKAASAELMEKEFQDAERETDDEMTS